MAVFQRITRRIGTGPTAPVANALLGILTIAMLISTLPMSAQAQTVRTWINATGQPSPALQVSSNWLNSIRPDTSDKALFMLSESYPVWWTVSTPGIMPGVRELEVNGGGDVTFFNSNFNNQAEFQLANTSIQTGLLIANSTLSLQGIHLNALGSAMIGNGGTLRVDGSHATGSMLSVNGFLGLNIDGHLQIESGGIADVRRAYVGDGGAGSVTITGSGSKLSAASSFGINVGHRRYGVLNILEEGGYQGRGNFNIGTVSNVTGIVNVRDDLSTLDNQSSDIVVGSQGIGILNVEDGGTVMGGDAMIAQQAGSRGTATIGSANGVLSTFNSRDLFVGGSKTSVGGTGSLNINQGGLVTVSGTATIWSTGTVNLNGGRFEFGEMTMGEFNSIDANSGSMFGLVSHSDYTHAASLSGFQTPADVSRVRIVNTGVLYGEASLGGGLGNESSGEVEIQAGERLRFAGTGNSNRGEINNHGGNIRFDQTMVNWSSGFITGRGQFIADEGWTNNGVMAFSGGSTDIHGDVQIWGSGKIVTSGGGTTTFYDDVFHQGSEIRTAAGSNTVFFGDVSGASSQYPGPGFTGTGTVFMEGDLRPGNSPGIVGFEGSLVMGSSANMFIELAGREIGEFDQFLIDGNLDLDGSLSVELINGFELFSNDEFLIAEVDGNLNGRFAGLNEGDLVGNFNGLDLFISYSAGDGNDVSLFSAIPEPGSTTLCGFGLVLALVRSRRRIASSRG